MSVITCDDEPPAYMMIRESICTVRVLGKMFTFRMS